MEEELMTQEQRKEEEGIINDMFGHIDARSDIQMKTAFGFWKCAIQKKYPKFKLQSNKMKSFLTKKWDLMPREEKLKFHQFTIRQSVVAEKQRQPVDVQIDCLRNKFPSSFSAIDDQFSSPYLESPSLTAKESFKGPDGVAGLDEASQQSTLFNTSTASGDDLSAPSTPRSRKETSPMPPMTPSSHHPPFSQQQHQMLSHPQTPQSTAVPSPGPASLASQHEEYNDVHSPGPGAGNWNVSTRPTPSSPKTSHVSDSLARLYEFDDHPDRWKFLDQLLRFMEEKGNPITACPTISKNPLDLFRLYLLVRDRGGFLEVTKNKMWKDIAQTLGIGAFSAAYTLRKHYTKRLLAWECKYDRGGVDPQSILNQVEAGTKKKPVSKASVPSPAGSSNSQDSFPSSGVPPMSSMDGYPNSHNPGYPPPHVGENIVASNPFGDQQHYGVNRGGHPPGPPQGPNQQQQQQQQQCSTPGPFNPELLNSATSFEGELMRNSLNDSPATSDDEIVCIYSNVVNESVMNESRVTPTVSVVTCNRDNLNAELYDSIQAIVDLTIFESNSSISNEKYQPDFLVSAHTAILILRDQEDFNDVRVKILSTSMKCTECWAILLAPAMRHSSTPPKIWFSLAGLARFYEKLALTCAEVDFRLKLRLALNYHQVAFIIKDVVEDVACSDIKSNLFPLSDEAKRLLRYPHFNPISASMIGKNFTLEELVTFPIESISNRIPSLRKRIEIFRRSQQVNATEHVFSSDEVVCHNPHFGYLESFCGREDQEQSVSFRSLNKRIKLGIDGQRDEEFANTYSVSQLIQMWCSPSSNKSS